MTEPLQRLDMNVDRGKDGSPKKKKKRLSVERIYQKKSQLEHILLRPDAYIGSVEPEPQNMWVLEETDNKRCILQKQITLVPGFYKIFDEILVNAADNKQRDKNMNTIKIVIDQEKNFISIWNNGRGIPIEMHKEQQMFVPSLIFGHLLTSSNYDDTQKKVTGGRNGFGAKLCNIFSTKFTVETACQEYGKKFKQVWSKNMTKTDEPQITEFSGKDYTKISYSPDLSKFHMEKLDDEVVSLLKRRAYDIAGTGKGVVVYLNGEKIGVNNFRDYVELYMKGASKMAFDEDEDDAKPKIIHEVFHPRWEVCVTVSKSGFQQASFVNSIATTKGGTHVNYVVDQITEKMITAVQRKTSKEMKVKPFQIRNHLWVFVNCLIENPTFDSQTKENMTLRSKAFGSTCEVNEKFIKMVQSCGVMDSIMSWVKFKSQEKMNKQCSHNKKSKVKIPKLDDANDAGSKNSSCCTLILTEGDSAKTLAISGLSVVGRDRYGVFPLKGKLLNVREAPSKQIADNAEITSLLQIIGLNFKKKYATEEERKTLRYGKVMIMADQDQDGSHIKGLVINFIHANWPHLIRSNFLEEFITPIVKVTKGKEKISFFSLPEFEEWKNSTPHNNTWKVKYYKGLGTSTSEEAKEYFKGMTRHRIEFSYDGVTSDQAIEMAFSKKHIQSRKDWLSRGMEERKRRRELGMPELYLYHKDTKDVSYTDFINKELILFSNADNERSIPSVVDGLKPGQRKVLFTCFKRNDKKEVKVAQLAGSVAELSAYHHGENSLLGTIINLAQNFVGSNNINLLQPIGAFGSRIHGGKDAASPRYIFTMLSPLTRLIFPTKDDVLLNYLMEDNQKIEPEWYCPIIPMVLVNGADGIGTGYRSLVFNHCPRQLVTNIRKLLAGEQPEPMAPFFKNFKGSVDQVEPQKFNVSGCYRVVDPKSFEITELPVRSWTSHYKETVLDVLENGSQKVRAVIGGVRDYSTDKSVHFVVSMLSEEEMTKAEEEGLAKKFKLETSLSNTSMVLHDRYGCLKKYESPEEILQEFFEVRLEKYHQQKAYYEGFLEAEAKRLKSQARFILEKIDGQIILEKRTKRDVVISLVERGFPSDPVKSWKTEHKGTEGDEMKSETSSNMSSAESGPDYGYLLSMSLLSLTQEKIDELLAQRDNKIEELYKLRQKTVEDLWEEDLDAFLQELDRVEEAERQLAIESENSYGTGTTNKRQTKINAKTKPKAPKVTDEAKKPKKAKLEKQVVPNGITSQDEKAPTTNEPMTLAERLAKKKGGSKAPPKKAARKNKWDFDSSDDDDAILAFSDNEGDNVAKRETRKKPAKKYVLSDDDEGESIKSQNGVGNDGDSLFTVEEEDVLPEDTVDQFDAARAIGASKKPVNSSTANNGAGKKSYGFGEGMSDSENSEIEATKALIAKLTPTKSKPSKKSVVNGTKSCKDLIDIATSDSESDLSDKEAFKPPCKKQLTIFDSAAKAAKRKASSSSSSDQGKNEKESALPSKCTKTKKGEAAKKSAKVKVGKATKKCAQKASESDDENLPVLSKAKPLRKTKPKSKTGAKRRAPLSSDDEENSFEMSADEETSVKKTAVRAVRPGRGKSKICYHISSDDEQDNDDDFEL